MSNFEMFNYLKRELRKMREAQKVAWSDEAGFILGDIVYDSESDLYICKYDEVEQEEEIKLNNIPKFSLLVVNSLLQKLNSQKQYILCEEDYWYHLDRLEYDSEGKLRLVFEYNEGNYELN